MIKKIRKIIIIVIAVFLGVILIASSFTTVKSGEIGLKIRFGKITDTSLSEGVNFKIPLIESITKINIKVQKSEMSSEASTKDLQIVNTSVAVNYRINAKLPQLFLGKLVQDMKRQFYNLL